MKTVDQVSRGVAHFFDDEVRPSLQGWKGIAYGVAVGRMAANAGNIVKQYAPILATLGVVRDGMIDVDGLAADLRDQMNRNGGEMILPIFNDEFKFTPADVDSLVRHIERA